MGIALAQAAIHRGATVTLVHGPLDESLRTRLGGLQALGVTTAEEMHRAMLSHLPQADWVVMAAAVADVKPATQASTKLAKADLPEALPLAQVLDIVADLSHKRQPHQKLIGFAAQTGDIVPPALAKLHRKGLDAIVANPIDVPGSGFGGDRNQAVLITQAGDQFPIPPCSKLDLAHQIWDALLQAKF
jgi:phosphopantothenoylcysteine decarboxylase/phosphopantothenate--cysteine ligase